MSRKAFTRNLIIEVKIDEHINIYLWKAYLHAHVDDLKKQTYKTVFLC